MHGPELVFVFLWLVPIGFFAWRRQRAEQLLRGWITACEALGLRLEQRVIPVVNMVFEVVVGERDGVRVEVWSSTAGDERQIHARARFDRPTLLGMRATTHAEGAKDELAGPPLPNVILAGWHVRAHDPDRARTLITRLRKTMRQYPENGRELTIDDEGVVVAATADGRADEIEALLDEAIAVRDRVLEVLARIGAGEAQQRAAKEWAKVAAREHFAFDFGAATLEGRTEKFGVRIQLERTGALQTTLCFSLRAPARGRVVLGRAGSTASAFFALIGQVETPTGDPAFEKRFRASAATREEAEAVLDDGVRAALIDLPDDIWGGEIAGASLTLRADDVLPGEALAETLRAVDWLATQLGRVRQRGYRDPG